MFSDRESGQLGRPNSENGGGQDAKNLRVKVFYAKFFNFLITNSFVVVVVVVVILCLFQHGFILQHGLMGLLLFFNMVFHVVSVAKIRMMRMMRWMC